MALCLCPFHSATRHPAPGRPYFSPTTDHDQRLQCTAGQRSREVPRVATAAIAAGKFTLVTNQLPETLFCMLDCGGARDEMRAWIAANLKTSCPSGSRPHFPISPQLSIKNSCSHGRRAPGPALPAAGAGRLQAQVRQVGRAHSGRDGANKRRAPASRTRAARYPRPPELHCSTPNRLCQLATTFARPLFLQLS